MDRAPGVATRSLTWVKSIEFDSIVKSELPVNYIYIYIYHTWKRVGILATSCRRYGAENDAKWQKTT